MTSMVLEASCEMQNGELLTHRTRNWIHTTAILLTMAAILAGLGWLLAGMGGITAAVAFGLLSLWLHNQVSPKWIFRLYGGQPLDRVSAAKLHEIVERLSERAELPETPELYYIPSKLMNAMTVGSRNSAAIGITDGLLRGLESDELAGILAHEIAHLANGDTRVMGLADVLARITSLMSSFGKLLLLINLPLLISGAVPIPWAIVGVLLAAPIATALLQLALSRTREFDADINAARLTRNPYALISALEKLEEYNESLKKRLLLPGAGRRQPSLLRTHPHTEKRIQRLRQVADEIDTDRSDPDTVRVQRDFDRVERRPTWRPLGIWY